LLFITSIPDFHLLPDNVILAPLFDVACQAAMEAANIANLWSTFHITHYLPERPALQCFLFPAQNPIPNSTLPPHYDDLEAAQLTEEFERAVLDALFPPLTNLLNSPP
jgi:hypothetical protein